MKNHKFYKVLFALGIYFILYLIATMFQTNFWGDILSPVGAILSCGIILNTYFKSDRANTIKNIWGILSLACISWASADILWAVYELVLGINPENSDLISYLYMGTNICIFVSVFIYSVSKFRKWNAMQLFIDSIAVAISGLLFLWIMFFNKKFENLNLIGQGGLIGGITLVLDFALCVGISVWYLSIRGGKIPLFLRVTSGAILLYVVTDICYYYLYLNHEYIPNSVIDAIYMASLLGIALGANLRMVNRSKNYDVWNYDYYNVGSKHKGIFILLCPVLTIVFKGFVLLDLLSYIFIILCYESVNVYIQASIKNEQLFKREKAINLELEDRIAERTKELVEKNKQLDFLSNQDTVTNLYNRRYFIRTLEEMLEKVASNEILALLFIDLDRFKTINDTYGHYMGDQILIQVAKRLRNLKQQNDLLARLGGDEFVFAVQGSYGYKEIEKIAQRIIKCCNEAIEIEFYSFRITISVGVSIYPLDAQNGGTLMKNADIAMYQAKKLGYSKYVLFSEQLNQIMRRKNEIEILLRKADFDKEFMLFYQPQFIIPGKKLIGMEALIRWNSPEKGFISPGEFIPISEETDYIIPIGNWVMEKSIEQIAKWNNSYDLKLKMGINVSPKQLEQTNFINGLQSFMRDSSVKPEWIDVEITEGVAIGGEYIISETARQFKDAGVSISIDDFGTGYSSLSYLKFFPFDRIKIAKELIDTIASDGYDRKIIKFIIMLAKSIGIQTIAEGVESQEQFDILVDLGCEQIQGYYLGKPIPAFEFEETFLENNRL